ncbi:MAG: hypothetical protein NW226_18215 [Microscillaceae bacterium]|nr:hypothetical protein [Microscillaceae bacterium]
MNNFSLVSFYILILSSVLVSQKLRAQLNNEAFAEKLEMNSNQEKKLFLKLRNLNFLKNNEYFNPITSGQTFFGTFLMPSLVYYPNAKVRLEAGGFFWKDFGDDAFTRIAPIFRLTYQKDCTSVTFGNLVAHLNHQLIEPMYDFDNLIVQHLESGIQFKHHTTRFYVDLWVDWQNRIFRNDDESEIIFGGLVTNYKFVYTPNFELIFPMQTTIQHQGGQDLTVNLPVRNALNISSGLKFLWKFSPNSFLKSIRTEHYYVGYIENSSDDMLESRNGLGYYGTINMDTKWFDMMVNLWLGNQFDSREGGELYRSYSVKTPGFIEDNRELLFLRILKDVRLMPELFMTFRFEPYYDFNNQLFEYSFGIYMHYQPSFLLKKFN